MYIEWALVDDAANKAASLACKNYVEHFLRSRANLVCVAIEKQAAATAATATTQNLTLLMLTMLLPFIFNLLHAFLVEPLIHIYG